MIRLIRLIKLIRLISPLVFHWLSSKFPICTFAGLFSPNLTPDPTQRRGKRGEESVEGEEPFSALIRPIKWQRCFAPISCLHGLMCLGSEVRLRTISEDHLCWSSWTWLGLQVLRVLELLQQLSLLKLRFLHVLKAPSSEDTSSSLVSCGHTVLQPPPIYGTRLNLIGQQPANRKLRLFKAGWLKHR